MSKPVSLGKFSELCAFLGGTMRDLDEDAIDRFINKRESEGRFIALVKNEVSQPKILKIDRSQSFDPETFIGKGWSIWKGPADGDGLEGEEDQDQRSLALGEIDLAKVVFETCLKPDESSIRGAERIVRLKASNQIRLDAQIAQCLFENKSLTPDFFKGKVIFFDGTIVRGPDGLPYALSLFFIGGEWHWGGRGLCGGRYSGEPSAVLASS